MKFTFNLKKPNKNGESLILFSAYFKSEGKKFVYSTGEFLSPEEWNYKLRQPKNLTGRTEEANRHRAIQRQLDRYSNFFSDVIREYKLANREITTSSIKEDFDIEFKRTKAISSKFFEVYDLFILSKETDFTETANSVTTINRYKYNKKLLKEFEDHRKKKIHFNQINQTFYNSFIEFCIKVKEHSANTLRRNVGLFKTFMYWAFEDNHTYKMDFQKFKLPKAQDTDEVALTQEQIYEIFDFDLSKNKRLEKVKDLFVFGCATGMRYSNYSKVRKVDVQNELIRVVDDKNKEKTLEIPLNDLSNYILKKYEYRLPKISNQKFNDYLKELFELMEYNWTVKKTMKIGRDIVETFSPFYDRVSSHTARRSFITIMKNEKIPDKVIMSYTGHRSLEVFNKYYKPSIKEKETFMKTVWKLDKSKMLKAQ
ncbi:tyrosine-type recombinase/integrase [Muricauda sp. CAU 1633]|uniref:tyrosine-type recombinase/integrase n=1 Tax=Allomuricauda sp. CAU 1633 TaxID=2816036 RepID=UPI001A8C0CCD|nr:tyrosine-type recombinase/integrase [Muricauda sp. CAU 1633]MBO0324134.1 tyrosine-type recombinase/integrase [Muricauda sp. CAU 1633]